MTIIAILPVRGGSKGIYKKNIRFFDGKPLLQYQIEAALKSKYIDKIYVSTDDDEIARIAANINGTEIIQRPASLSNDLAKSEEALLHALDNISPKADDKDYILFLQATSPLTTTETIEACIEKAYEGFDSVCCATEDYGFFIDDPDIIERPMRQQRNPRIREAGNCWLTNVNLLKTSKNRLGGKLGYVLIDKIEALEIDEPEDSLIIESILARRNRLSQKSYYKTRPLIQKPHYEENYWGETIDPDGQKRNKIAEKTQHIEDAKSVIDYLNSLPGGKLLEVGCGFGFIMSAIQDKWEKHGTELSQYAANIAKDYAQIHLGPLTEMTFPDHTFDAALMYHSIEHIPAPLDYIEKVYSLLKVGGKLIIGTPDFDCITAQRFKENFRLLHDETHVSLFSTDSLRQMLLDFGFGIERIEHPFFETRHFTEDNLRRLFDTTKTSPPFYRNVVNIYAYKR